MSNMTFAEIHSLQFGLSESEIEECHLNNGVLQQSRTIYCFKEDEDNYSPRAVYLFNHEGKSKKVVGDDLELLLRSSDTSLSEFFGIEKKAMDDLLWMTVWHADRDVIPDHFSEGNFLEVDENGGEINVSDVADEIKAASSSCLISFSQFANCDFTISEDADDVTIPELDYSSHWDDREVARIYYKSN